MDSIKMPSTPFTLQNKSLKRLIKYNNDNKKKHNPFLMFDPNIL